MLGFALGSVALLVVLGLVIEPDPRGFGTHERLGLPSCKPMDWWSIPCPGCGVTTSIALAARGSWWPSIHNQPLGFAVAVGLPVFALWAVVNTLRGRNLAQIISGWRLGWWSVVLAAVITLSWAYKLALVQHWIG